MFFDQLSDISTIAKNTHCAIFVVPPDTKLDLKNALYLMPDDSKKTQQISVEQMRDFIALTGHRETTDRYFVITPADTMNESAQNTFLKTLEEPSDYCHFILLTTAPNLLLPTILSRSQVYIQRKKSVLDNPPMYSEKVMNLAKQMIAATSATLPKLADDIAKSKTNARELALNATAAAIEILYKAYYKTHQAKFLAKLPNFLALYDNLEHNGHIKLQIIANLC